MAKKTMGKGRLEAELLAVLGWGLGEPLGKKYVKNELTKWTSLKLHPGRASTWNLISIRLYMVGYQLDDDY